MVEVASKIVTPGQRIRERLGRIVKTQQRPGIRVTPRDDDMRRLLKHPRAGAFRSEGSMEWPDDSFTHRRLRDGSVKAEEKRDEKHDEKHHERSRHHAAKPATE